MLKYLTQKLQNSAITEEVQHKKVQIDEDQDSGTESDDNIDDEEMESPSPVLIGEVTSTSSPYFSDGLAPHDILYDHQSSEEELEVINNLTVNNQVSTPSVSSSTNGSSSTSKRKWSQVMSTETEDPDRTSRSSLSSDEEVTGLFSITPSLPLQFRTSPPVHVQRVPLADSAPFSPRKRSRLTPASPTASYVSHPQTNANAQRPCLDFEKMQQMKARSVTSWRHGGELSVFCW